MQQRYSTDKYKYMCTETDVEAVITETSCYRDVVLIVEPGSN